MDSHTRCDSPALIMNVRCTLPEGHAGNHEAKGPFTTVGGITKLSWPNKAEAKDRG